MSPIHNIIQISPRGKPLQRNKITLNIHNKITVATKGLT